MTTDALKSLACLYVAERAVRECVPEVTKDDAMVTLSRAAMVAIVATAAKNVWTYVESDSVSGLLSVGREVVKKLDLKDGE